MRMKLPNEIEQLENGPHKRDLIRHLKKLKRKEVPNDRWSSNANDFEGCLGD